jgi:hypothetical protein
VGREEDGSRRNIALQQEEISEHCKPSAEAPLWHSACCAILLRDAFGVRNRVKRSTRGVAQELPFMFIYGAPSGRCAGIGGLRGRGRNVGRLSCYRFTGPWPRAAAFYHGGSIPYRGPFCCFASQVRASSNRQLCLFVTCVDYLRLLKQVMRRSTAQPTTTNLISLLLNPPASSTFFALKQASALSPSSP